MNCFLPNCFPKHQIAFSHIWVWWEKVLTNVPLKDVTMEKVRVEELKKQRWRLWMSQSCFSLGFLSQNSLWKLSIFRGYKGYLYWSEKGMRRVSFSKTDLAGDLALRLDWIASSSCDEWSVWTFCPIVLQLAWWFSVFACFTRVHLLAVCKPQATRKI